MKVMMNNADKNAENTISTDFVIIGGGIAGLWILNRLKLMGYDGLLLEKNALGGGQTVCSQGIIHGGIKYTLTGLLSASSQAIAEMPGRWRKCLEGQGEVDLRQAKVLSQEQFLWSTGNLSSQVMTFFASKAMSSRVKKLARGDYPVVFDNAQFKGNVYRLSEIVLDVPSVVRVLAAPYLRSMLKVSDLSGENLVVGNEGENSIQCLRVSEDGKDLEIRAKVFIFAAGEGNAYFLKALDNAPQMQRRPLHMVWVKFPKVNLVDDNGKLRVQNTVKDQDRWNENCKEVKDSKWGNDCELHAQKLDKENYNLQDENIDNSKMQDEGAGNSKIQDRYSLYAHCIDNGMNPRVTITTHQCEDGRVVWYIGGQIAEDGVKRTRTEQIEFAKKELRALFPWIDFEKVDLDSFFIDRAEPLEPGNQRPSTFFAEEVGNAIFVWPTKLALTPLLADEVVGMVERRLGDEGVGLVQGLTGEVDRMVQNGLGVKGDRVNADREEFAEKGSEGVALGGIEASVSINGLGINWLKPEIASPKWNG